MWKSPLEKSHQSTSTGLQQRDTKRTCYVCSDSPAFKALGQFADHLRTYHCAKEGGSYICKYGIHKICRTLPLEGVSQGDYEEHLVKEHMFEGAGTSTPVFTPSTSGSVTSSPNSLRSVQPSVVQDTVAQWTMYNSAQNLPAVLNDPRKSRRENAAFFTRHWGDSFVEVSDVSHTPLLPKISWPNFQEYLQRYAKRYRRHIRDQQRLRSRLRSEMSEQLCISSSNASKSVKPKPPDLTEIPLLFVNPRFNLRRPQFFNAAFFSDNFELLPSSSALSAHPCLPTSVPNRNVQHTDVTPDVTNPFRENDVDETDLSNPFFEDSGAAEEKPLPLLEPRRSKLAHYLDVVEVQIATQVASQSPAFFNAMTNHDELQVHLIETRQAVQTLREKLKNIDSVIVTRSFRILSLQQSRKNKEAMRYLFELMADVREAQPNVHLYLASGDYLGALDLIATTQAILQRELKGIVAFRHLSSQLGEIRNVISKMLQEDFIRYIQSELQKPVEEANLCFEDQNLSSLVLALLRLRDFRVIAVVQHEAQAALKALVRQTVQEAVSAAEPESDAAVFPNNLAEQTRKLDFSQWLCLIQNVFRHSLLFVKKVKSIQEALIELINTAETKFSEEAFAALDPLVTSDECYQSDKEDETSVADASADLSSEAAAERVDEQQADTESNQPLRDSVLEVTLSTITFAQERATRILAARAKDGSIERLPVDQFVQLYNAVFAFIRDCEQLSNCRKIFVLQQAFQNQAIKFAARFHEDKKGKLKEILDIEYWKQNEVPARFQILVDHIAQTGQLRKPQKFSIVSNEKSENVLTANNERFIVVGTALMLLEMIVDYCQCSEDVAIIATELLTRLEDLLRYFNSRTCQLIIGAGAIETVGLKSISVKNIALASRCLQLVIHYIPAVQSHFLKILPARHANLAKHFLRILEDYKQHVTELSKQLLNIAEESIIKQCLSKWEIKSPSPTGAFQQMVKQIKRLYEGVSGTLPSDQVQQLFFQIHTSFKRRLRYQTKRLEISPADNAAYRFVCSEFSFYMEQIRQLPCCATFNETLKEVLAEQQ